MLKQYFIQVMAPILLVRVIGILVVSTAAIKQKGDYLNNVTKGNVDCLFSVKSIDVNLFINRK